MMDPTNQILSEIIKGSTHGSLPTTGKVFYNGHEISFKTTLSPFEKLIIFFFKEWIKKQANLGGQLQTFYVSKRQFQAATAFSTSDRKSLQAFHAALKEGGTSSQVTLANLHLWATPGKNPDPNEAEELRETLLKDPPREISAQSLYLIAGKFSSEALRDAYQEVGDRIRARELSEQLGSHARLDQQSIKDLNELSQLAKRFVERKNINIAEDCIMTMGTFLQKTSSQWEKLYKIEKVDGKKIFRQEHGITGLKIYEDHGKPVVDIAIRDLGEGSYKRAKEFLRVTPEGITRSVRLARPHKEKRTPISTKETSDPSSFREDLNKELEARQKLSVIPNILEIRPTTYTSKGKIQERYTMLKGETFSKLIQEGKTKEIQQKFPSILETMDKIHEKKFVHADLKPDNLFIVENEAKIADFGLFAEEAKGDPCSGTFGYMAPEVLGGGRPTPKSDMFSLGIIMLDFLEPEIKKSYFEKIREQVSGPISGTKSQLKYAEGLKLVRDQLDKSPYAPLIKSLIDSDPSKRPTAAEALEMYKKLLASDKKP